MLFAKLLTLFVVFAVFQVPASAVKKSYIVYLGGHSHGPDVTTADLDRVTESHTQLLASFLGSEENAKDSIIYSFKRHINGFAALLEEEEVAEIAKHPGVASVFANYGKKLHTTHSWEFLRLETKGVIPTSSAWKKARYGEDTIIANVDTGVWPESKSFSGEGYGPIPSRWKGACEVDNDTKHFCNRKLIGARYFNKGYASHIGQPLNSSFHTPRDSEGHGTHTLSTAAGNFVPGASVFGAGNGTAKGGSPRARAAAYKVCWPETADGGQCFDADIMKAFDVAINDGVDVISLSVGGPPSDYQNDGIAIASFHAVKYGIPVVASAGNEGPLPGSVSNVAPWIFTVGASTIDRELQATVFLKNGRFLKGLSVSPALPRRGLYPLISSVDAKTANATEIAAKLCIEGSLDPKKAEGKIVVCLRGENSRVGKGSAAALAGASGMILCNDKESGNDIISDPHVLPATHITYADGLILYAYLNSTKNPEGYITAPKAVLDIKPSPFMAAFSSRGPNSITPEILKPDITAPGVNIIAAYTEEKSPTELPSDKRVAPYNILSGTSMSCPHVAGLVGLLKTLHPHWSPAAIKSAIMTSARTRDNTVNPMRDSQSNKATPQLYGAGDIRPNRAVDPGLVYDLSTNDYLDFLCGIGYNQTLISRLSGSDHVCPKNYSLLDFNYPSISVININGTATVTRKVKNVGQPGTYAARIRQPLDYTVTVEPPVLKFEKTGEVKAFKLTIKARRSKIEFAYKYGQLIWSDKVHYVRSPIVILPVN